MSVELYISAALQHGMNTELDRQVGALEDFLRAAWELLTPEQKLVFATRTPVIETMTYTIGGIPEPELVGEEALIVVFGENGEHPDYPRGDWKNDDTKRGYWDWVDASIERDSQDSSIHLDDEAVSSLRVSG